MAYKSQTLKNRIYVGPSGQYSTLKGAVDWFNASAASNTEIICDAGNHSIADTITVNNGTYSLAIRGLGFSVTSLNAATGLTNKPMFDIKTTCTLNRFKADGSTLGSYGSVAGENFANFTGSGGYLVYMHDVSMDTFKYGVYDTCGADLLAVDFIMDTMDEGVVINHTGSAGSTDLERATFVDCAIGVDFVKSTDDAFILRDLVFSNPALGIGIKYDGTAYNFSGFSEIVGCTHNGVGTFISGFDFHRQDGRDANIVVDGNVGIESKAPHAKHNVIDNTTATTVTTAGTYYKAANIFSKTHIIFDAAATAGTFTITIGDQTTGNIAYDASAATIKTAIENLSNITTVTVTQVVASKEWWIQFDTATEGWDDTQTVDVSGLTTTTSVDVIKSFYNCKVTMDQNKMTYQPDNPRDCKIWLCGNAQVNQVNRNVGIGIKKNNTGYIISPMTVRCAAANQPYPFSLVVYLDDVAKDDYFEIFLTSSTNGDLVILQDLTWYFESR